VDQTPLEFAAQTGMDSTMRITQAYHRVRYGSQTLSTQEVRQIENWLTEMEEAQKGK
jgi:hypothetical protein